MQGEGARSAGSEEDRVVDVEPSTEPVIGWRIWNLSDEDGPVLQPAGSGSDGWPWQRPMEARCTTPRLLTGHLRRHEAPDPDCRCGVYASRSLPRLVRRERPAWPPPPVIGRVALWGRTIVHERGWRARFAYPDRLRLVCALCASVEPGPGEPTVVHAFAGRVYPLCGAHEGGIQVPDGRRTRRTETDPRELLSRLLDAYAVEALPFERVEPLFARPAAPEAPPYFPSISAVPTPP
jgi:hypothetical protein